MNLRLISFFFLLLSTIHLFASIEISSKQITIADGLANNTVRHFMQDSKGFIWLGTFNGLNRYDGNSFISYYPSSGKSLSLAERKVHSLDEDKNGFLWIYFASEQFSCYDLKSACFVDYTGSGEYMQKYSSKIYTTNNIWLWHDQNGARKVTYDKEKFKSVTYRVEKGNLPSNKINFITEGTDGIVWIGTSKGLIRIENDSEKLINNKENFHHLINHNGQTYFYTNDHKVFLFDASTSKVIEQTQLSSNPSITGNLLLKDKWIIFTKEGTFRYDFSSQKLLPDHTLLGENIQDGIVTIDNKKNLWISNHTGQVWYINTETEKTKKLQLIAPEKMGYIDYERYRFVHDSRNIVWISTYGNGLFAYDLEKDKLNHFTAGMSGFSHINSDYLLSIMEDRSGEIWVSCEFAGISRISVINEGSYRYFPENPNLLDRSNTIRMAAVVNDNEIWIGTRQGGLYKYDADFNLIHSKTDFHSNIYAIAKDAEEKTWLGTRGDGLCVDDKWYTYDPSNPYSIRNNNIFCFLKDSKQRMWIGTFGGGLNLARKEEGEDKYKFSYFFHQNYSQRFIRSICEDNNGMVWMGTSEGLYIFQPDSLIANSNNYFHYNYESGDLQGGEVKYLFNDSKGNIWFTASGAGFSFCPLPEEYDSYRSLNFKHYGTKDGLCNDVVQTIAEDKQGNIWLSTEYGISKFTQSENIFENYFFSAYSQGNVYTESSVCQCKNGKILFGSNYGFVVFDPKTVKKSSMSFPVVFTNINVNGINMLPGDPDSPLSQSLAYSEELSLKHNQNSIVIDFSSFNYADDGQTKYSYKLAHYDKNWSSPSTLSFATYKMLPPGNYKLMVKSCNSSGIWNDHVSSLSIIITPPFYLTGWAFLLYALFIIAALVFTVRIMRNFNRLNNRIAVEKQLTEYKLVFFTNISHEFRTPLTLIQGAIDRIRRIDSSIPKEFSYPLQTMEKSTRRMLRLIDQLLEFRKMQNNKLALSLEKTDVVAMLYEIFLSFEDMAESKNMDFQFIPSVTSHKMYIDKGKLDKMTYNLLSNAFKYTPQGGKICLYVQIDEDRNVLEIQVTDTGVGIPKEKRDELFKRFMQSSFSGQSVGVGLHLTHELVQVHKGEISYKENKGGGSIFTVSLPLDESAYEEKDFLIANDLLNQEKQSILLENTNKPLDIKPNPLNKQKILVIEDDIDVRQYLLEELRHYFQVETADNGIAGLEKAKSTEPDLIVCDVLMPGMNGYEVTRKLKTEFVTSHIPVILLTALALPENHLEGIESGADAYLSKPFSIRLLLARIVKLLEQREKLKEKFSEEPGIVRTAIYGSDRDKEFVDQLHSILSENLSNSHFSVDEFATLMDLGRTVFYRKVKGVTGYSPNEYLRIMRMKKAAELLLVGNLSVSEVSYKVGIDDPFYFSKCFKAQFGVAPSVYQKGKQE
ncbi:hybrid sensor histidine kinase/response regulator transcription factor [Bacteroides sp. 224]|uniref:hybrid sensor histidine kinase/response regulator transcription factor n=1 Tax=Bacteroides sp. 224 TaxID=2302936 RepID=UPI0013D38F2C|nr:hybrid sensor histidine kinase/response regulator transcription factor [Bacteroides sp. 224]NDV64194.1 hybrid sensor histidine kinase/response regulator [Bacteroides sp. 224]